MKICIWTSQVSLRLTPKASLRWRSVSDAQKIIIVFIYSPKKPITQNVNEILTEDSECFNGIAIPGFRELWEGIRLCGN